MGGKGSGGGIRNPEGNPTFKAIVEPEGVQEGIGFVIELNAMPLVDLSSEDEVRDRITDYLSLCAKWGTKPLVGGLAQALGMNRRDLSNIVSGKDVSSSNCNFGTARGRQLSPATTALVKNAYENLHTLWEFYFTNGYIRDAPGIFLAKNHFGYRDEVETVVVPKSPLGESGDPAAIVERYAKSLPEPDGERLSSD